MKEAEKRGGRGKKEGKKDGGTMEGQKGKRKETGGNGKDEKYMHERKKQRKKRREERREGEDKYDNNNSIKSNYCTYIYKCKSWWLSRDPNIRYRTKPLKLLSHIVSWHKVNVK